MTKLKNLLLVAGVPAVLIGASTLMPPTPGHSQGAGLDGFPVQIVNQTAFPVPVRTMGATAVAGTIQAQQSGNWNVSLGPDASVALKPGAKVGLDPEANGVKISNTPAAPAFVRSVDEGARQPFQGEAIVRMSDGNTAAAAPVLFANNTQTVPAGKRLVIEQVAARAIMPLSPFGGFAGVARIETNVEGRSARHFLPLEASGFNPGGLARSIATVPMRVYADPGTTVSAALSLDSPLFGAGSNLEALVVSISGYFVDVP